MSGKQLRNSILQWAISGRLVPQDPADEPASHLLARISRDGACPVSSPTKRKSKPLPPISDEEKPFEIPASWEWVRLGDVCSKIVDGDHNPPKGELHETEYLMLSSKNVNNNRLNDLGSVRYLSKSDYDFCNNRTNLKIGDVLLTTVATIGRSCVYEGGYNLAFQRSVSVITTHIYNYYLKFCLDSPYCQTFMNDNAKGTAQRGFYINQLEALVIPLPPLAEQRRIVERIEELMPWVERYDKAQGELDRLNSQLKDKLKKSILQEAISGRLVPPTDEPASKLLARIRQCRDGACPVSSKGTKKSKPLPPIPDEEKPFEIPDSWEWVRLQDVADIARGGSPRPIKAYITDEPDGINWIKIGDTDKGGKYINSTKEKIKPCGVSKSRMVHKGDFLLTNSMSFGRPYILNTDGCIHDGWLVISLKKNTYDQDFLYYLLSSQFAYSQFSSKVAGAVVNNLNSDKVASSVFPLPPLAEQHRIVEKIEQLFSELENL